MQVNPRIRVSGLVVVNQKVLLIEHTKDNRSYWLLPGGGVDLGEPLSDALEREFFEELNIKIKVNELLFVSDSIDSRKESRRHIVNVVFACDLITKDLILSSEKRLTGYDFFSKHQIDNLTLFPPIKKELFAHVDNKMQHVYLGSRWEKLL